MATIRKRRGKWQVQIRRKGQSSVSKSFNVLRDAQAWARQIEIQADRSDLPADPKALERITLRELVSRYRDTVSPRKRSCSGEQVVLKAFMARPICSKSLSELRTADFAVYRDLRLQTIKPTTLKRELTPIRHMFEVAKVEWGLPIKESPLDNLQLKAPDQRRERRLQPGELDQIAQAAGSCRNHCILPIILLALTIGMRRSELLALKWNDIDLPRRLLIIREAKNGHCRTIPLTIEAARVLEDQPRSDGRIFPISPNAFRLAWERLRRRAGIADLHFHDLRHEAISSFFEKGLSVSEVALISGHKDMRMLFRYSHAIRENILEKLDRITPAPCTQTNQPHEQL